MSLATVGNYRAPKVSSFTVAPAANNTVTFTPQAFFVQITNLSSQAVSCKLNGDSSCIFTLEGNASQVFNPGDAYITSVGIYNTISGNGTVSIEVIYTQ